LANASTMGWMRVEPQQRNAHPREDRSGSINLPTSSVEERVDCHPTLSQVIASSQTSREFDGPLPSVSVSVDRPPMTYKPAGVREPQARLDLRLYVWPDAAREIIRKLETMSDGIIGLVGSQWAGQSRALQAIYMWRIRGEEGSEEELWGRRGDFESAS